MAFKSIVQWHNEYINGVTTPVDTVTQALKLCREPNAANIFTHLTPETATHLAAASKKRFSSGTPLGLLDGISIACKDIFDQKDHINTAGSLLKKSDPKAQKSAKVIAQLERAGGCFLGRTTLSEFAFSGIGINPHFGTPASVLSEEQKLLPGGSSSGSAVAVGLGIAQVGLGTDTSGSIRVPAALNGLFGFRPTIDRYSREGVFPLARTLDSVGVMTHFMEDLIVIDDILLPKKGASTRAQSTKILDLSQSLALAWDDEVYNAYHAALKQFETLGYKIEACRLDVIAAIRSLFKNSGTLVSIEARLSHKDILQSPTQASLLDPFVYKRLSTAPDLSDQEYKKYLSVRQTMLEQASHDIGEALIAFPTVPSLRHEAHLYQNNLEAAFSLNAKILAATMLGSFIDAPGVALPLRNETQKVIGSVLISARQGQDERLLQHCKTLAKAVAV